jgi:ubiquinone/menaquinone biosynthesis C-methylase UbiE
MVDLDTYRTQSLATWAEMAPGWEARSQWMDRVAGSVNEWILDQSEPHPGQTVLDIAAGPGDLGFKAADRVDPGGKVISSDFSPEMVDVARRIGEARGHANIDYMVMDAERMDLPDDFVDVAICRWGYMLMADPAAALRETRRVLRDGGQFAFAVWAEPERNPWAAIPAMTLVERGHLQPPEPGAPGLFALAEPARVRELVVDAGFSEPSVEEVAFTFGYADFDELWDTIVQLAGPLARAINGLPTEEQRATRGAIAQNLASYRRLDGSYSAPGVCWGVSAR